MPLPFQIALLQLLLLLAHRVDSLPLSTSGKWVVDAASGDRVKLRCVCWAAHMQAVVAEGLDKKPLSGIATRVASLGFNCVRLTWATYMFTNESYANLTVGESLDSLGLSEAVEGVDRNNPSVLGLTVVEAYDAVVQALGEAELMVVLDNHVSRPEWCCGGDDGNGFFGDLYFDTMEWLRGLEIVATRFKGCPQVVGMSMRNELRGPNQSEPAWYHNIHRGARTIHRANPDVLVIVSGLSYDTDLTFLSQRPLSPHYYDHKLVFEAHWYAFSEGRRHDWEGDESLTRLCSDTSQRFDDRTCFVSRGINGSAAVPLFVSEFGVDQRGTNRADNRFLRCFLFFVAERDLDWAMWALQGSYYLRNGHPGFQETYGVLDTDWDKPKNPKFQERFRLIQEMIQDPGSAAAKYQIIYHPMSGQCVWADEENNVLLSDCRNRSRWNYEGDGAPIRLMGTAALCLKVAGEGLPMLLSNECSGNQSVWTVSSSLGFQVAGMDAQGRNLCMERNLSNSSTILTNECSCLEGSVCSESSQTQWFRFISSNIE